MSRSDLAFVIEAGFVERGRRRLGIIPAKPDLPRAAAGQLLVFFDGAGAAMTGQATSGEMLWGALSRYVLMDMRPRVVRLDFPGILQTQTSSLDVSVEVIGRVYQPVEAATGADDQLYEVLRARLGRSIRHAIDALTAARPELNVSMDELTVRQTAERAICDALTRSSPFMQSNGVSVEVENAFVSMDSRFKESQEQWRSAKRMEFWRLQLAPYLEEAHLNMVVLTLMNPARRNVDELVGILSAAHQAEREGMRQALLSLLDKGYIEDDHPVVAAFMRSAEDAVKSQFKKDTPSLEAASRPGLLSSWTDPEDAESSEEPEGKPDDKGPF